MSFVMVPCEQFETRGDSRGSTRGKPRPPVLRALGHDEPPLSVQVAGEMYRRVTIFKHDSMAATALYTGPAGLVTCKFSRTQPLFILPLGWLGRRVSRHEARLLTLLADLPNVPALLGPVCIDGKPAPHVMARKYIEGHPLANHEKVNDEFFPRLKATIETLHARDIAYVDLHKRENIIVDKEGQPHLIDFQVSFVLPRGLLGLPLRWLLRLYQVGDRHHLLKHMHRHRPDQLPPGTRDPHLSPPLIIGLWRKLVATPFRQARRMMLVLLGVRKGRGRASSEHAPEDAVQREMKLSLVHSDAAARSDMT